MNILTSVPHRPFELHTQGLNPYDMGYVLNVIMC